MTNFRGRGMWVTLTDKQIKLASDVGAQRHANRVASGSVHKNNLARDPKADLERDQLAARCELAAHIGLGTKRWFSYGDLTKTKQADLDGFIDVKERRRRHHRLIVQLDANPDWAYVSVCSEEAPKYLIDGWCWGYEAKREQYKKSLVAGRPAYVVDMAAPIIQEPIILSALIHARESCPHVQGAGPSRLT